MGQIILTLIKRVWYCAESISWLEQEVDQAVRVPGQRCVVSAVLLCTRAVVEHFVYFL